MRNTQPLAVIDIGSNSVKLLVARRDNDAMHVLCDEMRITRLGGELRGAGLLGEPAMRRTIEAVVELLALCPADRVVVVGTEALRIAGDADEFRCRLLQDTDCKLRVLSGDEEARLSYAGAAAGFAPPDASLLAFDIGGGSAEFIHGVGDTLERTVSLPLGASALTGRFLQDDPPAPSHLDELATFLRRELVPHLAGARPDLVVGIGGTVTTIAALEMRLELYDGARVHRASVSGDMVEDWLKRLARMTLDERKRLPGLHPGRAGVIVAGVAAVAAILDLSGADGLLVSDHGLRHGVWRQELA